MALVGQACWDEGWRTVVVILVTMPSYVAKGEVGVAEKHELLCGASYRGLCGRNSVAMKRCELLSVQRRG